MVTERCRQTPPARLFKRIGAYRFFVLITLPSVLLLCLVCGAIFHNLSNIQHITSLLRHEHLPGILESQRTQTNIATLHRNAELIYISEDSRQRRTALLDAKALIAESVFETSPHFADFATRFQALIVKLDGIKKRAECAADSLHDSELKLSGVLARLYRTFQLPNTLRATHSARHLTSPSKKANKYMYQNALRHLTPLTAQCARKDLTPLLQNDCAEFKMTWQTLSQAWEDKVDADDEARGVWFELNTLLRRMNDATSMEETKRAHSAMEHINQEARKTRMGFYVSCILLGCILLSFILAMHRYFLAPLALAAQTLRRIRFGRPVSPLPPVRIRELQELFDLLPSIRKYLTELSERSGKLEQEKNKYVNLSLIDGLTGVSNRRHFDLDLAQQASSPLSLLMIDVDMFKLYNDTLGHQAGDNCLLTIAQTVEKALLRSNDRVFRYGGEEFVVILPEAPSTVALAVAGRIMDAMHKLNMPHKCSPVAAFVTISVGIATRGPEDATDNETLIKQADKALYRAKSSGRNQVCIYTEKDDILCSSNQG